MVEIMKYFQILHNYGAFWLNKLLIVVGIIHKTRVFSLSLHPLKEHFLPPLQRFTNKVLNGWWLCFFDPNYQTFHALIFRWNLLVCLSRCSALWWRWTCSAKRKILLQEIVKLKSKIAHTSLSDLPDLQDWWRPDQMMLLSGTGNEKKSCFWWLFDWFVYSMSP